MTPFDISLYNTGIGDFWGFVNSSCFYGESIVLVLKPIDQ